MNLSGGCISPRPKNAYSTVSRPPSCAMVRGDPQPLPMSPRPPAALPRAVEGAGGDPTVQCPEKSGRALAAVGMTTGNTRHNTPVLRSILIGRYVITPSAQAL